MQQTSHEDFKTKNKESPNFLFFWGSRLSQWYESPFDIDGVTYLTAEHFMMAEKARLFNDVNILKKILSSKTPALAKKLGRNVSNFDESLWVKSRLNIVVRGNLAKFSQHEDLKTFLLETGDKVLVEASPYDRIWGIGMSESNPDSKTPAKWKGLNLLGIALMKVRNKLKLEKENLN